MMKKILVTGATGRTGAEVVKLLQKEGVPFTVGVRSIEKARQRFGNEIDLLDLDFERHDTHAPALADVESVFLVFPPSVSYKKHMFPFIDAARDAGVERMVFLSLFSVERYHFMPHYHVEQHIIQSGMAYTMLQANFFMQNLDSVHLQEIRDRNELFIPVGNGKSSLIDVRDIAVIGVSALTEEGHGNKAYPLTGGESVDYYEVADLFTAVLGRKITYKDPSLPWFVIRNIFGGSPIGVTMVMSLLYTLAKRGRTEPIASDLEALLGRSPISVREYIEDYKMSWMGKNLS